MLKKLLVVIAIFGIAFSNVRFIEAKVLEPDYIYSLDPVDDECNTLFGDPNDEDSTAHFLDQIFDVFKWVAPLLCLVFSVIEFVKAAASQDKEALNKAATKTVKRVILALILFFIPGLIDFLFPLLGWYGTCGIG